MLALNNVHDHACSIFKIHKMQFLSVRFYIQKKPPVHTVESQQTICVGEGIMWYVWRSHTLYMYHNTLDYGFIISVSKGQPVNLY